MRKLRKKTSHLQKYKSMLKIAFILTLIFTLLTMSVTASGDGKGQMDGKHYAGGKTTLTTSDSSTSKTHGSSSSDTHKGKKTTAVSVDLAPDVEGLAEAGNPFYMVVGLSQQFTAKANPPSAPQSIDWSTSSPLIISVDDSGLVEALSPGTASLLLNTDGDTYTKEVDFEVYGISSITDDLDFLKEGDFNLGEKIPLSSTLQIALDTENPDLTYDYPVIWSYAPSASSDDSTTWKDVQVTNTSTQSLILTSPGNYVLKATLTEDFSIEVEITVIENSSFVYIPVTSLELSTTQPDPNSAPVTDLDVLNIYALTNNNDINEETSLYVESYAPDNASINALVWGVDDPNIVRIDSISGSDEEVHVVGLATGNTAIRVYSVDKNGELNLLDSCLVSVALNPEITDPVYIKAVDIYGNALDQFDALKDIYIEGYNIPALRRDNPDVNENYYLKVTQKGNDYESFTFTLTDHDYAYDDGLLSSLKLVDLKEGSNVVDLGDAFSKEYFVSISKSDDFPKGDDDDGNPLTWTDNFKITSPVPTGELRVSVELNTNNIMFKALASAPDLYNYYDSTVDGLGDTIEGPRGYEVILARVLFEENAALVGTEVIDDYIKSDVDQDSFNPMDKYVDEVKMVGYLTLYPGSLPEGDPFEFTTGHDANPYLDDLEYDPTDPNNENYYGYIEWDTPRESLKIGGYVLLINLPEDYSSNLDLLSDTSSEDDGLLKQISIRRDEIAYRHIIIYEP